MFRNKCRKLSWVLNNTDRQSTEYEINFKQGHVQIDPGGLEFAFLNTLNLSGTGAVSALREIQSILDRSL